MFQEFLSQLLRTSRSCTSTGELLQEPCLLQLPQPPESKELNMVLFTSFLIALKNLFIPKGLKGFRSTVGKRIRTELLPVPTFGLSSFNHHRDLSPFPRSTKIANEPLHRNQILWWCQWCPCVSIVLVVSLRNQLTSSCSPAWSAAGCLKISSTSRLPMKSPVSLQKKHVTLIYFAYKFKFRVYSSQIKSGHLAATCCYAMSTQKVLFAGIPSLLSFLCLAAPTTATTATTAATAITTSTPAAAVASSRSIESLSPTWKELTKKCKVLAARGQYLAANKGINSVIDRRERESRHASP